MNLIFFSYEEFCKRQGVSTVHRTANVSHTQTFLARGARLKLRRFVCLNNSHSRAHVMFRTLLEPAPFSPTLSNPTSSSTSSSSVLYPPNTTNPCAPKPGLLFGRLAEESPLTDSSGTQDPTPTPPKDCKAYHRRLMPALASATDPLALENESQWRLGVMRAFCAGALLPLMPC